MPAERVSGAVAVRPDPRAQPPCLGNQLLARHGFAIVVHDTSYNRGEWPLKSISIATRTTPVPRCPRAGHRRAATAKEARARYALLAMFPYGDENQTLRTPLVTLAIIGLNV